MRECYEIFLPTKLANQYWQWQRFPEANEQLFEHIKCAIANLLREQYQEFCDEGEPEIVRINLTPPILTFDSEDDPVEFPATIYVDVCDAGEPSK